MPLSYIKEGNNYKYLTDGKWQFSNSKKTIPIYSPSDNSLIGNIQAVTTKEIDLVMLNAKKAQLTWNKIPVSKRAEIIIKASELLLKNKEVIANSLIKEVSKPKTLALSEVGRTADLIKYTAEEGLRISGEILEGEDFYKTGKKKRAIVTRVPLGLVLAISPFNYPVNLSFSKVAPALISGNSVVLRPSTQGAISVLHAAELFLEAGLPPNVLNVVTGNSSEIGDYLVQHKEVDMIAFTGSTSVGKHIASLANIKPLLMELGGKDAAIILEDADLELAVKECVQGTFSYSGQRCTAIKRIILVNSIADKFVDKFVKETDKLTFGKPEDDCNICPLINIKAADYIQELIDDANKNKAKQLMCKFRKGNLFGPTIFDHVTNKCRLYYEEQFGPVAVIIRAKDEDEAIKITNDSEYGLEACIFTKNMNKALHIAEKLNVGTVQINGKSDRGPDNFPFPCIKNSGLGTQGIRYSIEAMTRIKSTILNL